MKEKYTKLFQSFTLPNGVEIKNRIVMAPMTTWGSDNNNFITDSEISFYTRRAKNIGMVITGCTHVSKNGIGFENEFSAYDDKFLPVLTKLATKIKAEDTKAVVQINHAGNKALQHLIGDLDVVSASDIETLDTEFASSCKTRSMTELEIKEVIKDFGTTTKRLIDAGFDGVEIHGAHGFLIQNFMSPFFNKRTDEWGGNLENRMKFPLSIVREIKEIIKENNPNFILGYRISPDEPMDNALRIADNLVLIDRLIELGIDYLHISLPNALVDKPVDNNKETYLTVIENHVAGRVPLIVAGQIKTPTQATEILDNGYDFVALGRILVNDPDWATKVLNGEENKIETKLYTTNKDLCLPEKLIEEIIKNIGWFDIAK